MRRQLGLRRTDSGWRPPADLAVCAMQHLDEELESSRYAEAVAQCGQDIEAEFEPSLRAEGEGDDDSPVS